MTNILEQLDREQTKEEKRESIKKEKRVTKARQRMGVGLDQPSIMEAVKKSSTRVPGVPVRDQVEVEQEGFKKSLSKTQNTRSG